MRRSHRIAATAAATTGLAALGGYVTVAGTGTPQTQVLVQDTAEQVASPQLQSLQDALAELQAETTALQDDLAAAQRQLELADKARAAALAAAQAAAAAPQQVTVRTVQRSTRARSAAPGSHTRTGASGAGGEHEDGEDD